MIRVTSGTAKNKKINIPEVENIRVSQDVVRQAIFTIIGQNLKNQTCLDLYAGSGVLGIEALSRGAKWCDFVDVSRAAYEMILDNLKNCGFDLFSRDDGEPVFDLFQADSVKFAANTKRKYDIIFADPFYEDVSHKYLVKNLDRILKKHGRLVFLHNENLRITETIGESNLEIMTERRFGQTVLTILSHKTR